MVERENVIWEVDDSSNNIPLIDITRNKSNISNNLKSKLKSIWSIDTCINAIYFVLFGPVNGPIVRDISKDWIVDKHAKIKKIVKKI